MSKAAERDARATLADLEAERRLRGRRHAREVEKARDELKDLIVSKYVHQRHSYRRRRGGDSKGEVGETNGAEEGSDDGVEGGDCIEAGAAVAPPAGVFPGGCRNSLSLRRFLDDEKAALKARLSPGRRRRKLVSQQREAQAPFPEHIIAAGKSTTAILRDFRRFKAESAEFSSSSVSPSLTTMATDRGRDDRLRRLQAVSLADFRRTRPTPPATEVTTVLENARRIRQRLDFARSNTLSSEPT